MYYCLGYLRQLPQQLPLALHPHPWVGLQLLVPHALCMGGGGGRFVHIVWASLGSLGTLRFGHVPQFLHCRWVATKWLHNTPPPPAHGHALCVSSHQV